MKIKNWSICILALIITSCSEQTRLQTGEWTLEFNPGTRTLTVAQNNLTIADGLFPTYKLSDKLITPADYAKATVTQSPVNDAFGNGTTFNVKYTGNSLPEMNLTYYIYPGKDYLLTDFTLSGSQANVATNYMAPVNAKLPATKYTNGRALFVPFDNDKWIRYSSVPLPVDTLTSYEVTSVFDNTTRNGLVAGSVEHDTWKTAVTLRNTAGTLSLVCYGGVADEQTRDSKPHGTVQGNTVKSPKILLGRFDDWRTGMEKYADANATIAPRKAWGKAVPFGWNSWGVLQFGLTYPKALEVADFIKKELQDNNFHNTDGDIVVGLDSGWNSFSEEELKSFVDKCKANGQIAGVYWTPFTDWGRNPERRLDYAKEYYYKDAYLYANGKPQELDGAYALDPTHPAVEEQMKVVSELFHRCGFEYVKVDFMTHGAMEADKWHNPEVQTGIGGYNYGMKLLNKYFGDMYINLSISPVFPAQYAQSRRIACDAWNKIKDTEYTMNAMSYGWWQDRVYSFNDADHIVLKDATEGENRARVTSSVITGMYICGDDFSKDGLKEGKEKSIKYLTNKEVNAIATGKAFRPVEGNGERSENQFVRFEEDGSCYYALFNYTEKEMNHTIDLERIGLAKDKEYQLKELWSGTQHNAKNTLNIRVEGKDVLLFQIK